MAITANCAWAAELGKAGPNPATAKKKIDFSAQIRPLLSSRCFQCHGPDEESREADLRLDLREQAIAPRESGAPAIKPGSAALSGLIARVSHGDPNEVMPPPASGDALKPEEIAIFRQWIDEGAEYTGHWAFRSPVRPAIPAVTRPNWSRGPIDAFVLAKLADVGLEPSPEADRHTLARRAALDITGLPPAIELVDAFVADKSPDAFENYLDRLLESPAYGERWARIWLDLARYADSKGYGSDPLRLNIWPYRDWVIHALNRNLPYDQFTREQLAGDLLPSPTNDQLVATAFHRNTMTNTEGGTIDEEWRVAAVKDRTAVTLQAWMGLTMGCAQCHTHKFDPITQREFYQTYAIFNQTEDNDQGNDSPLLPLPTAEQTKQREALAAEIAKLKQELNAHAALRSELAKWEAANAKLIWKTLAPAQLTSTAGAKFEPLGDGSYLVSEKGSTQDTYTLEVRDLPSGTNAHPHRSPDRRQAPSQRAWARG